jgi:sulfur carrier protein
MRVKINGKEENTAETTLLGLLESKKIEPRMVSVELNGTMLRRPVYAETAIKDGDLIELLYFMGGGREGTAPSQRTGLLGR